MSVVYVSHRMEELSQAQVTTIPCDCGTLPQENTSEQSQGILTVSKVCVSHRMEELLQAQVQIKPCNCGMLPQDNI